MLKQVAAYIQSEDLFRPDDRLLLAVSGGVDSMVMWHLLRALGYSLGVAHGNFGLRGAASDADEALVRATAARLGTDCYVRKFPTEAYARDHKLSIQEAARDLRYAFFEEVRAREGFAYVLTAHHLDDRLETFWLNFTRGAGWRGLAGLPNRNGYVRRPLLATSRAEIEAYQTTHAVTYREDASNATDKYRRNYFRRHVLPALYAWTPDLPQRARSNFETLEEMLVVYEERIAAYRAELFSGPPTRRELDLARLRALPAAATAAHELLGPLGFTAEQLRQVLTARPGTVLETDTHVLLLQADGAILEGRSRRSERATLAWPEDRPYLAIGPDEWLTRTPVPAPAALETPRDRILVNAAELQWPLTVRSRRAGDRFQPLGMEGREQKLQDFFVNQKIDRLARARVPLLVNGDGRIIWVVGRRMDEGFRVRGGSEVTAFAWLNYRAD